MRKVKDCIYSFIGLVLKAKFLGKILMGFGPYVSDNFIQLKCMHDGNGQMQLLTSDMENIEQLLPVTNDDKLCAK